MSEITVPERTARADGPAAMSSSRLRSPWDLARILVAALAIGVLVARAVSPYSYSKDLQQPYLMGLALRNGLDIYSPITELSARYFPTATTNFPHPSPYPPVVALLSVPLTFVPMPVLVPLWLGLSVSLLVLVGRWLGLSTRASLALAAWPPMWWVLYIGQLELGILVLALLAWRDVAAGKEWRAGTWLGVAAAIKFYPVLFLAPYLYRRRWRVLVAGGLMVLVGQLGNLLVVGPSGLYYYYKNILPSVGTIYLTEGLNGSPYGALLRIFGGATDVAPLVNAPFLVVSLALALAIGGLAALFLLEPEAAPPSALLVLPTAWGYYAVLALPLIGKLTRKPGWTPLVVFAVASVSVVLPIFNVLLPLVPGVPTAAGSAASIVADLLLALQPIGYIVLVALATKLALSRPKPAQD